VSCQVGLGIQHTTSTPAHRPTSMQNFSTSSVIQRHPARRYHAWRRQRGGSRAA
jgi:hypothetical protein